MSDALLKYPSRVKIKCTCGMEKILERENRVSEAAFIVGNDDLFLVNWSWFVSRSPEGT